MDITHAYVNDYSDNGLGIQKRSAQPIVEFFKQVFEDEVKSAATGTPQFREVTCIRLIIPGDLKNIVERRVEETDKRQYAAAWRAFERSEEMALTGTPLEMWPRISRPLCRQLKGSNIFTVQQLAALDDNALMELGVLGGRTLRRQAQEFMQVAETGRVSTQIVAEVEALKKQNDLLVEQLKQANARFEQVLREKGADMSRFDNLPVPEVPVTPKAPAPNPIPDNWQALSNKELFALVDKVVGVKVNSRAAAEEAIEDALASRK